jgi:tetratricopeptide (TPR) repeat protein
VLSRDSVAPDHPRFARHLNDFGRLNALQGNYVQAEACYQRSLLIRERVFGPEHLEVAQTLKNLACLYSDQGKYTEAVPIFQRALALFEQMQGLTHPEVIEAMEHYAKVLCETHYEVEAETWKARAQQKKLSDN